MPIWLDELECINGTALLSECSHSGWGNENCEHTQDAGVVCNGIGE